jgi:DNA-directed RNA polymerase subunit F
MIKNQTALSIVEAEEVFENAKTGRDIKQYFKKFGKLKASDAKKLRQDLENSEVLKLRPELIAKVIDILPRDTEDINNIFIDVSLDKNEIDKILEIVKKYK